MRDDAAGRAERRPRPVLALALVAALVAVASAAWAVVADDRACPTTGVLDCVGPSIAAGVVGTPLVLLLAVGALRVAGARSAWLGLLFLVVGGWLVVSLTASAEPPLWAWPGVLGGLAAAYVAVVEPRVLRR